MTSKVRVTRSLYGKFISERWDANKNFVHAKFTWRLKFKVNHQHFFKLICHSKLAGAINIKASVLIALPHPCEMERWNWKKLLLCHAHQCHEFHLPEFFRAMKIIPLVGIRLSVSISVARYYVRIKLLFKVNSSNWNHVTNKTSTIS